MGSSDMLVFTGSGTMGSVTDSYSTGNYTPMADQTQDYMTSTDQFQNNTYNFTTMRSLDTGDTQDDFPLQCGNSYNMQWIGNDQTANVT